MSQLDGCPLCEHSDMALAFDRAGQPDSAIARYRRYVDTPLVFRIYTDQQRLAHALRRLGELYEEAGDTESALLYYAQFVELWENADAELQPQVDEVRAKVQALVEARG